MFGQLRLIIILNLILLHSTASGGYRSSSVSSKNMGEFSCATLSELGNGVRGGITSGGGIHRIEGGYHRRGGLATEKVIGPKNKLVQINLITLILTTPILAENNL